MIKVLSWNIACLPNSINFFSNPNHRISSILEKINEIDADIICLQEVFDREIRKKIINYFKNVYFYYFSKDSSFYLNNGLLTLSKNKFVQTNSFVFNHSSGEDSFANKGFHYLLIENNQQKISIINTHLNANPIFNLFTSPINIRIKQMNFIYKKINNYNYKHNIICGDINCDFNDIEKNMFLSNLKKNYKYIYLNKKKINTFEEKQLDYIIYYTNNNIKNYDLAVKKIKKESDHYILISEIIL